MDLFCATSNTHKLKELQNLFNASGLDIHVHSANEIGGMPDVHESKSTFEGNAQLKCRALKSKAPENSWVLADDSGLSVDALDGAPGVLSARYAGDNATDEQNRAKLIDALKGIPEENRTAKFICCLVLYHPSVGEVIFTSALKGKITLNEQGQSGFGYDPIFIPNGQDQTFAQMSPNRKNLISHRALAVQELIEWLKAQ